MKFLTAMLLVFSASTFAGHHDKKMEEMKKMPFDQHKKMMQEKLEMKSGMVEEAKNCVNNAKDNDGGSDNNARLKVLRCHKGEEVR